MLWCQACQKEMSNLAKFCNQCGGHLPEPKTPPTEEELREDKEFADFLNGKCGLLYHMAMKSLARLSCKYCHECGMDLNELPNIT